MIIFRPHRHLLEDSMLEAREFETIQDMKKYIALNSNGYISIENIIIDSEIINDSRTNWKDTRHVLTTRYGRVYNSPQCIGMCATQYEIKKEDHE